MSSPEFMMGRIPSVPEGRIGEDVKSFLTEMGAFFGSGQYIPTA
jgi:hypothetical protein